MSAVANSDSTLVRRSIDALLERYVYWREQCAAVRQAYQWWGHSEGDQRAGAYAGYVAALDREERAARAYARQVERVGRIWA
jgi:hypothetical protein